MSVPKANKQYIVLNSTRFLFSSCLVIANPKLCFVLHSWSIILYPSSFLYIFLVTYRIAWLLSQVTVWLVSLQGLSMPLLHPRFIVFDPFRTMASFFPFVLHSKAMHSFEILLVDQILVILKLCFCSYPNIGSFVIFIFISHYWLHNPLFHCVWLQ